MLNAPVDWLPLVALLPLQSPLAVQAVALVVVQLSVAEPPCVTAEGVAVRFSVGSGVGAVTVTVTSLEADPPAPLQVNVNVVVWLSAAVICDPLIAFAPVHPPLAEQLVALVEDQVSVDVPPCAICTGFADSETVGAGGVGLTTMEADCVADPPAPVQLSV